MSLQQCFISIWQSEDARLTVHLTPQHEVGMGSWQRFYEWIGKGHILWGSYRIAQKKLSSASIGLGHIHFDPAGGGKIWRFNPSRRSLHFGQLNYLTGGKFGEPQPEQSVDEMVLRRVTLGDSGFVPFGAGSGEGDALRESFTGPFKSGPVNWRPGLDDALLKSNR